MKFSPKKKILIINQELHDDILSQIFLRLPAITVIRLKSVCKSWCELINSKNFQIYHLDHWRIRVSAETKSELVTLWQSPPALLSFEPVSNDDIDIPSKLHCRPITFDQLLRRSHCRLSDPPKTTVLHSDEGLLLLSTQNQLFLCNPLNKSFLYLPFPKKNINQITYDWTWTFVYDPSSRIYVIFYVDSGYTNTVYSLRIGSGRKIRAWRQVWSSKKQTLTSPFPKIRKLCFRASLSINGKAHFLIDFGDNGILTIDTATEESIVTKCSGPKLNMLSVFFKSGREFYGLNESSSGEAFELWVIDDVDNPIWERQVIIKPTFARIRIPNFGILKEGDRIILYSRFGVRSVFIYDTSLEKWQEADIVGNHQFIQKLMHIHYSVLSLTN